MNAVSRIFGMVRRIGSNGRIGPCMFGRSLISETADRVANLAGFCPQTPDITTVAEKFGGNVEYGDPGLYCRIETRGKHDFTIWVDGFATKERTRFNIAHMLGHFFLHLRQGERIFSGDLLHAMHDSVMEQEANYFAVSLLMPARLVTPSMLLHSKSGKHLDSYAEMFHIPRNIVETRLNELMDS